MPGITRRTAGASQAASIFALAADVSHSLSTRSDEAIGPLLAAAAVPRDDAVLGIHPIWTTESLHRAHATLKLFLMLHRSQPRIDRSTGVRERRLAVDLARTISAISSVGSQAADNCAGMVRNIARTLVALFGPGVGGITLETDISEVSLPGARRRALALLTHELIVNAILHAFVGRRRGRIIVALRRVAPCVAVLSIMDDGIGIGNDAIADGGIAAGLAAFLGSDIFYGSTPAGLTKIDVIFKIEQMEALPCGRTRRSCVPKTPARTIKDYKAQIDYSCPGPAMYRIPR